MDNEKKFLGKWWLWILLLVLITLSVLTFTNSLGKIFTTAVERQVFEQSYQKQAGDKSRLNTYQSQLNAINTRLTLETDEEIIKDLRTQKSMLETQINSIK